MDVHFVVEDDDGGRLFCWLNGCTDERLTGVDCVDLVSVLDVCSAKF